MRFANVRGQRILLMALAALVVLRLGTLGLYPLMDTTEARYAEIARTMLELNDWITPWFRDGVPFWGKPPLSFWITAASFKLFGVNEFAARLPHWLMGVATIWLVWLTAAQRARREAMYAAVLLAGSGLFFLAAGAVMTDMVLTVSTTIALRGFWLAIYGTPAQRLRERWLFFIGIGLGLLAKGPVALVLIGIPVVVWAFATRMVVQVGRTLPWLCGSLLALLIAVPWYVGAELKTPGFLQYFVLGEHWHRFVTPGWTGDLYGSAHQYPTGTIWLFALADLFPWTLLLPLAVFLLQKDDVSGTGEGDQQDRRWWLYLLGWGLAPCVFFTLAGNILWAYVLPGMPALALLGAALLSRFPQRSVEKLLVVGMAITGLGYSAILLALHFTGQYERKSAKALITAYTVHRKCAEPLLTVGGGQRHSASFYSNGKAEQLTEASYVHRRIAEEPVYVAVETSYQNEFLRRFAAKLVPIGQYGTFVLYQPIRASAPGECSFSVEHARQ